MKRKSIISVILAVTMMVSATGCGSKEKTTVITEDVKQEITMQEDKVKEVILQGNDLLNNGKYDEAKSTYEKAISMDKANKGAYIEIKNKYIEKQRLDDAYYFIKLAISNNIDTENMNKLLNDVKSKFEVATVAADVYVNDEYTLPNKINAKINNQDREVDVVWNNNIVDTSNPGDVTYQGRIEQYDRSVQLNLKVKEIEKAKKIGYIKNIYDDNGESYLKYDEVEFYKNKDVNDETADIEARKDGKTDLPGGKITNDYYIRNNDKTLVDYEISPNVQVSVCGYMLDLNTVELRDVSYEKFKNSEMSTKFKDLYVYNRGLFYLYLENNVVVKIEQQFIP